MTEQDISGNYFAWNDQDLAAGRVETKPHPDGLLFAKLSGMVIVPIERYEELLPEIRKLEPRTSGDCFSPKRADRC